MKYINALINIVIGLAALSFSYVGFSEYFGGNEEKVVKYEQLLKEGKTTIAILDSVYTETTIKGISLYSVKYTFKVEEEEYGGKLSFDDPDEMGLPIVRVNYMEADPSINTPNVEEKLEKAKKATESNFDLIIGIVALLVGLYMLYSGGRRFVPAKKVASNDEFV